MEQEHQDETIVPNVTIPPPALRISTEFEDNSVTRVDVEINDDPAGRSAALVDPQYIGDVVAAVVRATAPLTRLRLSDPARMATTPSVRAFHEGGLVR